MMNGFENKIENEAKRSVRMFCSANATAIEAIQRAFVTNL